jgi:hypothetical protein
MIDLFIIAATVRVIGEVLVVLAVLHMHHTMIIEHRIDKRVVLTYKQERLITVLGLLCIVSGFFMEVVVL